MQTPTSPFHPLLPVLTRLRHAVETLENVAAERALTQATTTPNEGTKIAIALQEENNRLKARQKTVHTRLNTLINTLESQQKVSNNGA